jgi:hypothetical protein
MTSYDPIIDRIHELVDQAWILGEQGYEQDAAELFMEAEELAQVVRAEEEEVYQPA